MDEPPFKPQNDPLVHTEGGEQIITFRPKWGAVWRLAFAWVFRKEVTWKNKTAEVKVYAKK